MKDYKHSKPQKTWKKRQVDTVNKTSHDGATPAISEHALLRFIQRIGGADLSELQDLMLHPEIIAKLNSLGGNGRFPHPDFPGMKIIFSDYLATTILCKDQDDAN
tara:strand:+ start:2219 stop:2533 length:315 start_codon:yes stop_codon:yes gene_type:complete